MSRDEVFENGQSLAEGGADRQLNDATCRVAHETSHARHLRDLADVTLGAADGHDVHAAVLFKAPLDHLLDLVGRFPPNSNSLLIALIVRDQAHLVLFVDLRDARIGLGQQLFLLCRQT